MVFPRSPCCRPFVIAWLCVRLGSISLLHFQSPAFMSSLAIANRVK